ncbi:SDR family NAD(P)-dependent oxidoreductase [Actinomyces viscosus]|uniref:SDR family NAD(P)-dependent oxidoreductase n=1 Tax=Actinomyces viscosus TaxID=1656 RepID=UPI0028E86124|nr:SDR family NAD(P)-dependent oxidoreductase [Actinomyces viscosus]
MATQTWFITGSSRGFGRALAEAVLEAGDRLVATARKPEQLADLVERYGESRVLPVALDVTSPEQAQAAVQSAVEHFGQIDVVVNNAGYANIAPIETAPEEDFRRQFDTNFWGVYNVSKAFVPVLRRQGSGVIVQFSSLGGRVGGHAGLGAYQAAKFAVDGFTRVLAAELAPFGVRCLVVEPGGFATDWAGPSMEILDIDEAYRDTVGAMANLMSTGIASEGDPVRAGQTLVRILKRDNLPGHILFGARAAQTAIDYSLSQIAEATTWLPVSVSLDFERPYPVELPDDV